MVHAHSSPLGILFSDSAFDAPNTVYARRTTGEIELVAGAHEELKTLFDKDRDPLKSDAHTRTVKRAVAARFPNPERGLVSYGVTRALQIRRMRRPPAYIVACVLSGTQHDIISNPRLFSKRKRIHF